MKQVVAWTGIVLLLPSILIPVAFLAFVVLAPWIKVALWIWS